MSLYCICRYMKIERNLQEITFYYKYKMPYTYFFAYINQFRIFIRSLLKCNKIRSHTKNIRIP